MSRRRGARRIPICISVVILAGSVLCACKTTGGTGATDVASAHSTTSSAAGAKANAVVHDFDPSSKPLIQLLRSTPGNPSGPLPAGSESNGQHTAQRFDGTPTVGALFLVAKGIVTTHYCTASVVHSSSGDLIATAAHCVYDSLYGGYMGEMVFIPGYYDFIAPHGTWIVKRAYLASSWVSSENPDADVAFLTVQPAKGASGSIESAVGAYRFAASPGYTNTVDVVGYPLTYKDPVSCATSTKKFSATQLTFSCGGFTEGTSGSPFLVGAGGDKGEGTVVGLLGGYQQGGDTSGTSYSTYFGPSIDALYQQAASGG
jgi:V8-like Glu-specific endopeptidase